MTDTNPRADAIKQELAKINQIIGLLAKATRGHVVEDNNPSIVAMSQAAAYLSDRRDDLRTEMSRLSSNQP